MAHIPYGYEIKNGKAVLNKGKATNVQRLFEEYVAGASLVAAGKKTGVGNNHSSLGRIIDNSIYMEDGFYPPIISKEIWHKAQEERKRRAEALGRNKNYFARDKTNLSPFWGKIYCAECGTEYRRYSDYGKERWKCGKRMIRGRLNCNSPMIPEQAFEEAFMRMLGRIDMEELAVPPEKQKLRIERKYDDPFRQAEYVYSKTLIDDFAFQTEKLLEALQDIPAEFDGEFMLKVIKGAEVSHSGTASFVLINGKRYGEELIF